MIGSEPNHLICGETLADLRGDEGPKLRRTERIEVGTSKDSNLTGREFCQVTRSEA